MANFESLDKIKELQDKYYSDNKKNIFFKNKQKLDCAATVCDNIPLEILLQSTIFSVPESNWVCVDYTIFKLYANPNNYQTIADNIIEHFSYCIEQNGDFQLHINLDSFTITALERYKTMIRYFCDKCLAANTRFSKKMDKTFIYNSPKSLDTIVTSMKPFIDPSVYGKIVICPDDLKFPQRN